jgi:hypothetical protein
VYRSRDWKILSDPLDQEVHRERSGQTVFIILASERQVDHDAVVFVELIFHRLSNEYLDGVLLLQFIGFGCCELKIEGVGIFCFLSISEEKSRSISCRMTDLRHRKFRIKSLSDLLHSDPIYKSIEKNDRPLLPAHPRTDILCP